MTFTQSWCHYFETAKETGSSQADYSESMNFVFANRSDNNSIYTLMTREIAESQSKDAQLAKLTTENGYTTQLAENIQALCKDGTLVLRIYKIEWLLGIITTFSTPNQCI
jgi:hypothetical protein